jgi:hypothetical protein
MPPESDHASTPAIIYKYTDRDGVEKILSNRTLRFARPSEMNDPFDVYIEDLLGMDLEEVHERGIDALCDLLTTNPQEYADRCGVQLESAEALAKILRNASDERTAEIRRYLKSVDIAALSPECKALRAEQPALRDAVVNDLRNCAIFCASRTPSNLLMWAHSPSPFFPSARSSGFRRGFPPPPESLSADTSLGEASGPARKSRTA